MKSLLVVSLLVLCGLLFAQSAPSIKLTQLSSREWVDLSKVSFVRLPTYLPPVPQCPDCQLRWGALLVVDQHELSYTEEAEVTLRKLLADQR